MLESISVGDPRQGQLRSGRRHCAQCRIPVTAGLSFAHAPRSDAGLPLMPQNCCRTDYDAL
ncbi:MAG: hypothetical protein ACRDGV_04385, partial [Candidatus Limnocylindria bacterium]